ncbi:hypothetical protein [Chryseobacterium indoltheticum]|uniref:hypothetical protein n=1 Tax=Chryseobacterium indoltheticum TaxID=254 RepID=UPI003F492D67
MLEFPNLEGSTYANQYVIGYPMTLVKVYQFEGVNPQTGLYSFTDFNGDGKISSPDDNKVVEKIGVEFFGGWTATMKYKRWSASFLLQFVKQRNWNYNKSMLIPGMMSNQPVEVLNAWSPSNAGGTYMQYSAGSRCTEKCFAFLFPEFDGSDKRCVFYTSQKYTDQLQYSCSEDGNQGSNDLCAGAESSYPDPLFWD